MIPKEKIWTIRITPCTDHKDCWHVYAEYWKEDMPLRVQETFEHCSGDVIGQWLQGDSFLTCKKCGDLLHPLSLWWPESHLFCQSCKDAARDRETDNRIAQKVAEEPSPPF